MPASACGMVASRRRNEAGTWVNAVSGGVSRPISAATEENAGPGSQAISLSRPVAKAARAAASAPATAAVARRAVGMGVGLRGGGGFVGTSPNNDVNEAYDGTAGRFARSADDDDDGKEVGR